ncbi:MAG: hypothetical protein R3B96_03050 [Pirellulaceae bacterium]
MLVIVSDLHLHDGSISQPVDSGRFHLFAERLAEMARHASWRADGGFQPVERIDLVLLGDVLDLTSSARWLEGNVRPWDDPWARETSQRVAEIVSGVLRTNRDSLRILRALASEGAIRIPAAMAHPMAMAGHELVQVPVRIHYMVGDADWQLHVPGAAYDLIRQQVAHALGLANIHTQPFPHDPLESTELLHALRAHRVLARHGDVFDPLAFGEDRDMASLNDAFEIEVIARFQQELPQVLGEDLPEWIADQLPQLSTLRPRLLAPVWLEGLLERGCPTPALRRVIKRQWDQIVESFLDLEIVRGAHHLSPIDLVDGLSKALSFSHRWTGDWSGRILAWIEQLRGAESPSFVGHALGEPDYRNRRARHIVYGHTHHAETIALDASFVDTHVLNQVYFNTGTWQSTQAATRRPGAVQEFIPFEPLSLVAFYQGDEREGRAFETWSSLWGIAPPRNLEGDLLGEDSHSMRESQAASARGAAPASRARSPHFGASTGSTQSRGSRV